MYVLLHKEIYVSYFLSLEKSFQIFCQHLLLLRSQFQTHCCSFKGKLVFSFGYFKDSTLSLVCSHFHIFYLYVVSFVSVLFLELHLNRYCFFFFFTVFLELFLNSFQYLSPYSFSMFHFAHFLSCILVTDYLFSNF